MRRGARIADASRQSSPQGRRGAYTFAAPRGASLAHETVRGRGLSLVVRTCPACGGVDVVWGTRRLATVSLRSRRTGRRVIRVAALSRPITGYLRLRTSVAIDAVVVMRP